MKKEKEKGTVGDQLSSNGRNPLRRSEGRGEGSAVYNIGSSEEPACPGLIEENV